MEKYFIGLDSGTSGIKAVLFDSKGNELYKKGISLNSSHPKENWFEEDVEEIWEKGCACIREITQRYPITQIMGVGITAQGDGLWMVDKQGKPVRGGCCFCDGRAVEELEAWYADGTAERAFELAGTRLFTGNQPCIVKWMENHEPESLKKADYLMHLKDVLFLRLTGCATSDATDQSLVFVEPETGEYDERLFKLYRLEAYRDKYPPLRTPMENFATITAEAAKALGLGEHTLISSGPMDVAACALGAGVVEDGHCCSIMGTAALHEMVISKPNNDKIFAGMTVSHVMEGRWLRLMASLAGTPNLEWAITTFGSEFRRKAEEAGVSVYSYIEDQIKDTPVGSNGVMFHPYLLAGGERAPFVAPEAKANFSGITVVSTAVDILRACYEGVAFAMLDCYSHMPQEIQRITLCGGGANSRFWCQMFADAVGRQVVTIEGDELGARGAAMLNAVIQKEYPSLQAAVTAIVKVRDVYEPNMENHAQYVRYYPLYKKTYEALRESWKLRQEIILGQ